MSLNQRSETIADSEDAAVEAKESHHTGTAEISIRITIRVLRHEPPSRSCERQTNLYTHQIYDEQPAFSWPIDNKSFGLTARARRESAGLTRAELAALAGIADSTLRNVETNRHSATASVRRRLVSALEALGDAGAT